MRYHRKEDGNGGLSGFFTYPALRYYGVNVRKTLPLMALALVSALPMAAVAGTTVSASLIPDGTYTATVEKVVDNKHIVVKMQNGVETNLTTNRSNVDFGKVKANDQIKLGLVNGMVALYIVTAQ